MSDIKCPFCKKELQQDYTGVMYCCNEKCKKSADWYGSWVLWEALIHTRKALELAITGLKNCKTREHIGAVCRTPEYVDKILEQITALEQKE